MAFSKQELEVIDDYKDLLEDPTPENIKTFVGEIRVRYGINRNKILMMVYYTLYGTKPFSVRIAQVASTEQAAIKGALVNLTNYPATGVPLTPGLFRANTKVVLYIIKNNQIVKSEKYRLTTRAELNDLLSEGGYNLVVMDSAEYIKAVEEVVVDNLIVVLSSIDLDDGIKGPLSSATVKCKRSEAEEVGKKALFSQLVRDLGEGFEHVYTDILDKCKTLVGV